MTKQSLILLFDAFLDYLIRQIHFMPLLPTIDSLGTTRLSCQGLKVAI
jgi:hypothetical protein